MSGQTFNQAISNDYVSELNIDLSKTGEQRLACPKCADNQSAIKNISFNVDKRVGVCFKCGWHFSLDHGNHEQALEISQAKPIDYYQRKKTLFQLLSSAVEITDDRASHGAEYLFNRLRVGQIKFPKNILFRAGLPIYREGEIVNYYDAIVCPFQSLKGDIIGAHRIFISHGKKAGIDSPKRMMPKISEKGYKGGAVRLISNKDKHHSAKGIDLAVCEGIETGLYINHELGIDVWCTGGTANMINLYYPKDVESIHIFGDHDEIKSHERKDKMTGQRAAGILAAQIRDDGIRATVNIPGQPGDWLDDWIHRQGGAS